MGDFGRNDRRSPDCPGASLEISLGAAQVPFWVRVEGWFDVEMGKLAKNKIRTRGKKADSGRSTFSVVKALYNTHKL